MAPIKILFFIAGNEPTTEEKDAFDSMASKETITLIRTNLTPATYGPGRPELCDYVAGTIPATHTNKPLWPGALVNTNQKILTDAVAFDVAMTVGGVLGNYTVIPSVEDGEITGFDAVAKV